MTESVLVYNRIAQNRRQTWLLVAVTLMSLIPFIGAASYGVTKLVVFRFTPFPNVSPARESQLRKSLEADYAALQAFDRRMEEQRHAREKYEEDSGRVRAHVMTLVTVGLIAVLGLLFWELASSPTTRLLAMCGARPVGASELGAKRLLENLAIGAGLPRPRLYVIDSPMPNAFAAGMAPKSSVVAVTQGLLALLDRRELEGVLAHELSHIGNRDTRLNTVLATIGLLLRMPDRFRPGTASGIRQVPGSPSAISWRYRICAMLSCPIFIYVFLIAPVLAAAIRAAISRGREFLADADAALLTRYPEGLRRALAKIQHAGSEVPGSNPAFSHLYFADPANAGVGIGLFKGRLLATHPPISDRISRLAEFNGDVSASVMEDAVRAGEAQSGDHSKPPPLRVVPASANVGRSGLTSRQIKIVAVFGAAVFCCLLLVLLTFGAK